MKANGKCRKSGQGKPVPGHTGFTLVEILIVVATIGVLSAVAVPSYIKARNSTQVKTCISNLKQIHGAKSQWAVETKKNDSAVPTSTDLAGYFNSGAMPLCPANGNYRIRRVMKYPSCTLYWNGHTMYNVNMDDDPLAD